MKYLATLAGTVLALTFSSALAEDTKVNWDKHCASCHGKDGKGQTKAGKMTGAKDQTDPQYQAALKDEKMFASVKEGMKDGGKERMKPFKDKLSDDEIKALLGHVRSFKK